MFKRRNYTWNDGKSLSLCDRTLIMGILNGTPDSFSGVLNRPPSEKESGVPLSMPIMRVRSHKDKLLPSFHV